MKAEITFSQVWYNPSLLNFFFRSQAKATLEELMNKTTDSEAVVLGSVEDYANCNFLGLDEIEEMFYNDSIEELANEFGIELYEENEDNE